MVVTSKRLPGIALTESVAIGNQIEKTIRSKSDVTSVVTKLGRPDLATEAMGEYESDSYLSFTPKQQNANAKDKQKFTDNLQQSLDRIPGVTYEITQPMQMRMDESITGTRGDVSLKIFGDDLDTLEQMAKQAQKIISGVPGASETQMEIISGAQELQVASIVRLLHATASTSPTFRRSLRPSTEASNFQRCCWAKSASPSPFVCLPTCAMIPKSFGHFRSRHQKGSWFVSTSLQKSIPLAVPSSSIANRLIAALSS